MKKLLSWIKQVMEKITNILHRWSSTLCHVRKSGSYSTVIPIPHIVLKKSQGTVVVSYVVAGYPVTDTVTGREFETEADANTQVTITYAGVSYLYMNGVTIVS